MNDNTQISYWIEGGLHTSITRSIERIAAAPKVQQVAVMPDVHLGKKVCNGIAVATAGTIFPEAIGGDMGCGYLMADVRGSDRCLRNERSAAKVLQRIAGAVPIIFHNLESAPAQLPDELENRPFSCERLEKLKPREARKQLGTLGRGNHFIELQKSNSGLHILIHSGSRSVGPAVLAHHIENATKDKASKLKFLDADSESGRNYLADMQWARAYAAASRYRMLELVNQAIGKVDLTVELDSALDHDHNHVQLETHRGQQLWVHRKGTQSIDRDGIRIIPGSMGTSSFVVSGRPTDEALRSCSHGAGRRLSRSQAFDRITARDLKQQMQGVFFDTRKTRKLLDEAPRAYKDIRKVMKAQRELVKIEEERKPLLNYKAG